MLRRKKFAGRKKKDGTKGKVAANTEEAEDEGPGIESVDTHKLEVPLEVPPQDGYQRSQQNLVKPDTEMNQEHLSNVQRTTSRPTEGHEVASSSKQTDPALILLKQKKLEALKKNKRNDQMASNFPDEHTINSAHGQKAVPPTTPKTDQDPNVSLKPRPDKQIPRGNSNRPDKHAPPDTNHRSDPAHVPLEIKQKSDQDNIPATTDNKPDPDKRQADTSLKPNPDNIQAGASHNSDPVNIQVGTANKSDPGNVAAASVVKPDTRYVIPSRDYRNDPRYLAYIRSQGIDPMKLKPTRIKRRYPRYGYREGWIPKSQADFGNGGAFPEVDVMQYPLGMGLRKPSHPFANTTVNVDRFE